MTAAFYAMVPRILDALRVPVEGKEPDHGLPKPPLRSPLERLDGDSAAARGH